MVEHLTGQEFKEDEAEVRLNGKPLELVTECHAGEGWAKVVELDYRTNQPVTDANGEFTTLTLQGKIELFPKTPRSPPPQLPRIEFICTLAQPLPTGFVIDETLPALSGPVPTPRPPAGWPRPPARRWSCGVRL